MSGWNGYVEKYSPEQHAALETALLTRLKQRGPLLTTELAEALGQPTLTTAWFLQRLIRKGQIWTEKQTRITQTVRGRCYNQVTLWGWMSDTPFVTEESAQKVKMREERFITAEDHEWMAYWRQHREQRLQQRQERRHAV